MKLAVEFSGNRVGQRLFFLLHGWQHSSKNLADLKNCIREAYPTDDIQAPSYPSSTWSNGDLREIAETCVDLIDGACSDHRNGGYAEIVLVGHSLGALLARKIFLIAHGKYSDYARRTLYTPPARDWAPKIKRLVLLAGMNRGWRLWPKNPHTPWYRWLGRMLLLTIAKLCGRARLVRGAHRGAPFVVNLRLDWLELMNTGVQPEMVVQIAGKHDTVIDPSDHVDLFSGQGFHYLEVDGTSHFALVNLDQTHEGRDRKAKFLTALKGNGKLPGEVVPGTRKPDPSIQQAVLLAHGIRDYG